MLRLDGDIIRDIRLAFGSVAPTVLRCTEAESWLTGRALSTGNLATRQTSCARPYAPSTTCGPRRTIVARWRATWSFV